MQKFFRCFLFAVAASALATPALAGELTIKIANGRATVIAKDVPLRQILAEWARVGNTRMVNAEKLTGGPITLELVDMPEKDALDILLRSAAGYLTAPRRDAAGASLYDRVMILATSRPPANTGVAPVSTFPQNRTVLQQMPPQPPPDDDDDGEPEDQGPVPPPGMYPQGPPGTGGPPNQAMPYPGGPQNAPPGAQPGNQPQAPFTAPRPGMLPPQPGPGAAPNNPYSPLNRPPGAPPPPGGPPGTSTRPGGIPDDQDR